MNKKQVQQRVSQHGEPLNMDKFEWDEKAKVFSTDESDLVLDFKGLNHITFKTGGGCTFDAGPYCIFSTAAHSKQVNAENKFRLTKTNMETNPNKDIEGVETTERIVIEYANLSGRESANRSEFRKRVLEILKPYGQKMYENGYEDGYEQGRTGEMKTRNIIVNALLQE